MKIQCYSSVGLVVLSSTLALLSSSVMAATSMTSAGCMQDAVTDGFCDDSNNNDECGRWECTWNDHRLMGAERYLEFAMSNRRSNFLWKTYYPPIDLRRILHLSPAWDLLQGASYCLPGTLEGLFFALFSLKID